VIRDVKPWGPWATLGLGFIALLVGQIASLTTLIWWYGLSVAQLPDFASDGVAVTLSICISTPIQVLLLALMARHRGVSSACYLGLTLPRTSDVVVGIIAVVIFILVSNGIFWLLRHPISTRHLSNGERRGLSAVAVADRSRGDANRRGNAFSRLSVSRLAPLAPPCLARDYRDRVALGLHPRAI